MEDEVYEYNGKKYKRVPSEPKCLGCDLLDEETAECLNPEEMKDCMVVNLAKSSEYHLDHFQFKEIN